MRTSRKAAARPKRIRLPQVDGRDSYILSDCVSTSQVPVLLVSHPGSQPTAGSASGGSVMFSSYAISRKTPRACSSPRSAAETRRTSRGSGWQSVRLLSAFFVHQSLAGAKGPTASSVEARLAPGVGCQEAGGREGKPLPAPLRVVERAWDELLQIPGGMAIVLIEYWWAPATICTFRHYTKGAVRGRIAFSQNPAIFSVVFSRPLAALCATTGRSFGSSISHSRFIPVARSGRES